MMRRALIGLVKGYRLLLSPWLGQSCRFEPTCSAYAIGALEVHGAARGTYLTLHRIARCLGVSVITTIVSLALARRRSPETTDGRGPR